MHIKKILAASAAAFIFSVQVQAVPMLDFLIDGNTFTTPFSITNSSTAGEYVTRFQLDIAATNTCFDTVSTSGDNVSPCQLTNNFGVAFTPQSGTGTTTGLVTPVLIPDGSTLLDISFTDFSAGEQFIWDIDVDHNNGSSTVTGNQLIGALATIDFSDGQRLLGILQAVAGNSDASRFTVTGITQTPSLPEPATLALLALGLAGLGFRKRQV